MTGGCISSFLIEAGGKSLVVAGAALLLLALLKRRSAAERACIAHFGMAAVLLVPLLVLAGPRLEIELLAPSAEPVAAISAGSATPGRVDARATQRRESAIVGETAAAGEPVDVALFLYAVPASLLVLMTLIAVARLFRLRARADVIVEQGWLTALAHAQRRMGIKHGTALLATRELRSPVSWGVLRPIILLSEDALQRPVDAEAIIAHELAHVARSDWLNLLIARIATAILWFNPLVWLLARQGHQLREEAADDAVLRADVPCTDYAALLVGAARHEGRGMLLAANGVAPSKASLSIRVRRILEPAVRRGPAHLAWGGSCAAGALLLAAPLAALTAVAPAAPEAPLARQVLAAAAAPAVPDTPQPAVPPAAPAPLAAANGVAPAAPLAPRSAPPPAPAAVAAAIAVAGPASSIPPEHPPAAPPIPPADLVAMRIHGVRGDSVAEYAAAYPSLRNLSPDQLVGLQIHNVSPNRLREYAALGYGSLDLDRLVEWGVHGVSPSFIRSLAAEGYGRLAPGQLTEFRIHGVTANFIRRIRNSGLGGLSPDRLVDLRVRGERGAHRPPPRTPRPPPTPG